MDQRTSRLSEGLHHAVGVDGLRADQSKRWTSTPMVTHGRRNAREDTILVVAGLLEPCGNIGTEARYELLPIPWTTASFAEVVRRTVEVDQGNRNTLEEHMRIEKLAGLPEDHNDVAAVNRGTGLRAWIVCGPDARPLWSLLHELTNGWSHRCAKEAARVVDALAEGATLPLHMSWNRDETVDLKVIVEFESKLLSQLESVRATTSPP